MPAIFLDKNSYYKEALLKAEAFLHMGKYSYQYPLKDSLSCYKFTEFNFLTWEKFGRSIKKLSSICADDEVYFLALTTNGIQTPGFKLEGDWPLEDYKNALSSNMQFEKDPQLFYETTDFILFGSSGHWAFYGDRDFDIIVGGLAIYSGLGNGLKEWPYLPEMPWIDKALACKLVKASSSSEKIYQDRVQCVIEHFGLDT